MVKIQIFRCDVCDADVPKDEESEFEYLEVTLKRMKVSIDIHGNFHSSEITPKTQTLDLCKKCYAEKKSIENFFSEHSK